MPTLIERRRTPRARPAGLNAAITLRASARVIDISACGVRLHLAASINVGTRAWLSVTLGGESITVRAEVRRHANGLSQLRRHERVVGAALRPGPAERQRLEQFLRSSR